MSPCSSITSILLGALLLVAPGDARVSQASAGAPLFDSEKVQLTDRDIAKLNRQQSALVRFGDSNGTDKTTLSSGQCKVFPGDRHWPSQSAWSTLDNLLGGALIKTVPLAASCYSSWPEYDSAECERVTSEWNDSHLQSVTPYTCMKHGHTLTQLVPLTQPRQCGLCSREEPAFPLPMPLHLAQLVATAAML